MIKSLKHLLFITFFIFINICISAQSIHSYDYVIDMHYYKSYYSKSIKAPSFVIYKLYKGGGDVNRASYSFKGYKDLIYFNYTKSGYDRGHLVPAEDFANSNLRLKSTFYYINCVPQTPNLNRGVWKRYESQIRKLSQSDSLLIICGGCDYPSSNSSNNKYVPKNCFKIVYDLKTKKCIYSVLFSNEGTSSTAKNEDKLKKTITFTKAKILYNKKATY